MSVEANKKVVRDYFAFLQRGELDHAAALLDESLQWWVPDSLPGSGFLTKQQIWNKLSHVGANWAEPLQFDLGLMTAEDDRVCVMLRSSARKTDGSYYRQVYHHLFILKNGKITHGYPFLDTLEFAKEVHGAVVQYSAKK